MTEKFMAGEKITSLLKAAKASKAIQKGELLRLDLALNEIKNGSEVYADEVILAHNILMREATMETKPEEKKTKEAINPKTKKKETFKYEHGKVYTIDGEKKRWIGPKVKPDGTKVKGYFMRVRS